jgi:hypothetical protein
MIQAINSAMCIGNTTQLACVCGKQASLFDKTNKYFYINKNNTGFHKALTHLLTQDSCRT